MQRKSDSVEISEDLSNAMSCLSPDLLERFQSLPEQSPSASTDPGAALALHQLLSALDPTVAARWHWRDTRKVLRSLRIIKETGRQTSEILTMQSHIAVKPR
jgi:tRNA dimethylallyltransferase